MGKVFDFLSYKKSINLNFDSREKAINFLSTLIETREFVGDLDLTFFKLWFVMGSKRNPTTYFMGSIKYNKCNDYLLKGEIGVIFILRFFIFRDYMIIVFFILSIFLLVINFKYNFEYLLLFFFSIFYFAIGILKYLSKINIELMENRINCLLPNNFR